MNILKSLSKIVNSEPESENDDSSEKNQQKTGDKTHPDSSLNGGNDSGVQSKAGQLPPLVSGGSHSGVGSGTSGAVDGSGDVGMAGGESAGGAEEPPALHPLSALTLSSIPVNWLPRKPAYTQKAEVDDTIAPNQTLYLRNLNDRVSIPQMRRTLQQLFEGYELLDIVLMKSFWRRGQAWVIFASVEAAARALAEFNGFSLFGHAVQANYALEDSHLVAKMKGCFVPTERKGVKMKPRRIRQRELLYRQSDPNYDPSVPAGSGDYSGLPQGYQGSAAGLAYASGVPPDYAQAPGLAYSAPGSYPPGMGSELERAVMLAQQKATELTHRTQNVVNRTLFVENLPENVTNSDVVNLFNKMPGFVEARVIVPRRVAFIDFDCENTSSYSLQVLQGQLINGQSIKITYAKH